jgi:hypothetical protein
MSALHMHMIHEIMLSVEIKHVIRHIKHLLVSTLIKNKINNTYS